MKIIISYIALVSLIAFSGCTLNPAPPGNEYWAGLKYLQIGMSKQDALNLVGQPDRVSQTVTASGVAEQYAYSSDHFRTPGQQFFTGLQEGTDHVSRERTIYLYFQNDRLTSFQNQPF